MIKRAVSAAMFVALAAGAVHSYDQVRFGDRTASFFSVAFFADDEARGSGGGRGFDRNGRGESERPRRRPASDDGADAARQSGESFEGMRRTRERSRGRSGESSRRGRHGSRGAAVSLEEVGHYTIIFAFATMLTITIDGLAKRIRES